MLWIDGLKVISEIEPRVIISKDKKNYSIIVGAEPSRGHLLTDEPKRLSEIANESKIHSR